MTSKRPSHKWQFEARFRRRAFGWKSGPAIQRVKEAVSEIRKVSRKDPILAAEGAVRFLEKVSPALEQVDSSSGAIGTAVNHAIEALVPVVAKAPADSATRARWLERLFEAHANDDIPYIELLADHWGELCASKETASSWADRLLDVTRMALSSDPERRGFFHGTTACLSSLFTAERFEEIVELVRADAFWPYKRWAVKALAAQGRKADAISYAEACRNPWASDRDIDRLCEEILLSSGLVEEAYRSYGLSANRAGTYLAWFRAVKKKYTHKEPRQILADLVEHTPGDEGKWFAAAKDEKLFEEAIALVNQTPTTDPRTLTRAARDFADENPSFAVEAGIAALRVLVLGYGYEITGADVWAAYSHTMKAAERLGSVETTLRRIRSLVASETYGERFVTKILGSELGLSGS
jgi:hypothetical protein